ncbi:MAG: S8 family serine peptidase [Candidatus Poseidoniia archaeon]|nr:S8 family serine peptidase [Candidatus Poseidoniia archaeon]
MRRLAAILLVALMLAGNLQLPVGAAGASPAVQAASEPLQPADDTESLPAPTAAVPWWERTSRDSDRNGIVDWLEEQAEPTAVGVSYGYQPGQRELELLLLAGFEPRLLLSDAVLLGSVAPERFALAASLPGVVMVEPYGKVEFYGDVQTPAIRAKNSTVYPTGAWDLGFTGKGVNVAIVDTGIDNEHPGLVGKFVAGYDAVCYMHTDPACFFDNPGRETDGSFDPDDGNQHGTACSGMATATGLLADGSLTDYQGAAPDASLVDVRIGSDVGAGPFENYLLEQEFYESAMNGLQWVIDHRDDAWPNVDEANYGIDIVSLSWGITSHEDGGSDGTDMHSRRLDEVTEAGVVVSVAAGNSGPDNDGFSGMGSSSLSVTIGALDDHNTVERDDDTIASYSSRGPRRDNNDGYPYDELKPDVSAPGTNIVQAEGCYTSGSCNNNVPGQDASNNGYSGRGSGTSYATPSVAGVMALLLEVNGNLTPAVVKEILRTTAEPRGEPTYPELDPFWNRDFGWGLVDALIAVEEAKLLEDPENVDVELQAHILETQTNDSVVIRGVSWARLGNVSAVQYRLDDGPWREVSEYAVELPQPTGAYIPWSISLSEAELAFSGDHTLFVRALGNDGFHSLTPHTHFQAEGHTSDETTSGVLVPLVLAITMVAGGAIAVVAYRSGRFTPPRD